MGVEVLCGDSSRRQEWEAEKLKRKNQKGVLWRSQPETAGLCPTRDLPRSIEKVGQSCPPENQLREEFTILQCLSWLRRCPGALTSPHFKAACVCLNSGGPFPP